MAIALIGLSGSRAWPDPRLLEDTLIGVWHDATQIGYTGIELMHGCAEGADTIGHEWAWREGFLIREFPADWESSCGSACHLHRRRNRRGIEYCPLAGHLRNQKMVDERPVLFVVAAVRCRAKKCARQASHDSHGATDCAQRAGQAGIPVLRITA